jgi:hypothetical protein
MATVALTANTNVSALTLANDDTIDLAGFQLNFDVQPTVTGIQVITPGTAGTCVFPVACVIPTWSFTAGTGVLISILPANCEIGSVTGGSASNATGVLTNSGLISGTVTGGAVGNAAGVNNNFLGTISGNVVGGSATSAHGVNANNSLITGDVMAGSAGSAAGVSTNNRTITGSVTGGAVSFAFAVGVNAGTITGPVTGGSAANASGVSTNNGTILGVVTGGSSSAARGVATNNANCIGGLVDGIANAVFNWSGLIFFVDGPNSLVNFPASIQTLYSLFGPLNPASVVDPGTTVIVLTEGGTAGFTGIEGISRSLGT